MRSFVASSLLLLLAGCPQSDPDLSCDSSPQAVSLATDVQPLLTAKCALSGCHDATYAGSYGDFTTANKSASMVNKKSLYAGTAATLKVVDPNALKNSTLWLKVLGGQPAGRSGPNGENVYDRMPLDADALSSTEQQLLKDWICTGAK